MMRIRYLENVVKLFKTSKPSKYLSKEELAEYQKYLANVRNVVFTIGFNRSGSSLIGDLLTAHPNIVMSNEANVIDDYFNQKIVTRESFLCQMIKADMERVRKNYVADQYQGCYDNRIEIIGDKHSSVNTRLFSEEDSNIEKIQEMIGLPVLFIFNVRNPYDMASSALTTVPQFRLAAWHEEAHKYMKRAVSYIEKWSERNKRLMEQIPAHHVFISRHETFVDNPKEQLRKICDFLSVAKTEDYLSACTAATHKVPNKSRDRIDWPEEFKGRVEELIGNYEFFSGYTWEI